MTLLLCAWCAATFVHAASTKESDKAWAVLVTGSKTYENYRHHADTAHAYHRIIAGGIDPSHIVSLQYNDVPNDPGVSLCRISV